MDCTLCKGKTCRSLVSCGNEAFEAAEILEAYQETSIQDGIQAAARLVDNGRAGTLSRIEEIAEFALDRNWARIGLAYCYGMEAEATMVSRILRSRGLRMEAVSCSTGALAQEEVNAQSQLHKVSCNPLGQAAQIRSAKVDLVVTMGLCLGHDILFQQALEGTPCTTLVVKDRTSGHAPLVAIRRIAEGM